MGQKHRLHTASDRHALISQYQTLNILIHKLHKHSVNPSKPNSSNYYTLPHRPNLSFLISDILAFRVKCQSAQMLEIKNGRLRLCDTEHSKCNHENTLGFKRLNSFDNSRLIHMSPDTGPTSDTLSDSMQLESADATNNKHT